MKNLSLLLLLIAASPLYAAEPAKDAASPEATPASEFLPTDTEIKAEPASEEGNRDGFLLGMKAIDEDQEDKKEDKGISFGSLLPSKVPAAKQLADFLEHAFSWKEAEKKEILDLLKGKDAKEASMKETSEEEASA